jgi:hypothetical protein
LCLAEGANGYRNIPLEDYSRHGDYGQPAVLGVRQEILEEEARVIRRIFDMRLEGKSLAKISKMFNSEKIAAPRPYRGGIQAWSPGTIHSMVRNERYRGRIVWNQTRKVRNPETGKKEGKPRPEEEWIVADEPELRIVSEEQWEKVQAQNRRTQEKSGISRLGGLERTDRSKDYLFSGLLICAICGRRIVIVGGTGKYAKYGCPAHRYKGVRPNCLSIRHDRLEKQLIHSVTEIRPSPGQAGICDFGISQPNTARCCPIHQGTGKSASRHAKVEG